MFLEALLEYLEFFFTEARARFLERVKEVSYLLGFVRKAHVLLVAHRVHEHFLVCIEDRPCRYAPLRAILFVDFLAASVLHHIDIDQDEMLLHDTADLPIRKVLVEYPAPASAG
jgi:hypothetical protein